LSLWVKPTELSSKALYEIISKGGQNPFSGWALAIYNNRSISFSGIGNWEVVGGITVVNQWQLLTIVRNGSIYTLYLNANPVSTLVRSSSLESSSESFKIGMATRYPNNMFNGNIDDIRIYNRSLSNTEVLALYNIGSNTFTYTPSNNDHVKCVMTSNLACPLNNPDTSNVITMTVNPIPDSPIGSLAQSFCSSSSPTIANLSAIGTDVKWYAASSGGSALSTSLALVNGSHYYASQTVNGCESSARLNVTVTVYSTPAAPTGTASQSFCSGALPTVANLSATGTAVKWYDTASGGSELLPTDALVNGNHYYASQTVNGCESSLRFNVTVTITTTPIAPTGASSQTFCSGTSPKVSNLVATGTAVKWYDAASGGSIVAAGTALVNGLHYYASQTVSGCESSLKLDVAVTVNTTPDAPTGSATQAFCSSASPTVASLAATGTDIKWYSASSGGSALSSALALVNGNHYYASQTVNGCESSSRLNVTVTLNPSPGAAGAISGSAKVCHGQTNVMYTIPAIANATSYEWSIPSGATGTSTTDTIIMDFPSSTGGNLVVKGSNGCSFGTSATLSIAVNTLSTDPEDINGTPMVCNGNSTLLGVVGGSLGEGASWHWYADNCGGTPVGTGPSLSVSPSATTTYYVRAENDCNITECVNKTITVFNVSVAATSISGRRTICAGDTVKLSVVGGTLGTDASWKWYSGSCNGTLVGTGASIIVSPAVNTTYFVRAEGDCNNTPCVSASITVNTVSTPPIAIHGNSSPWVGVSSTYTVYGGSLGTGATWRWYSGTCGGTFVGTGASITVSPVVATTYFVRAEGPCDTTTCASRTVAAPTNHLPTLTFTNNIGFVNHVVNPSDGTPTDIYRFEVRYTDVDGDFPALTYPRLQLDYEGNGNYTNANDKLYFMYEVDASDQDVTDGKDYYYIATALPESNNWKTLVTAFDDGVYSVNLGPLAEPRVLTEADISIFANDITFSDANPDPGDSITVSAVIHNYSGRDANNFEVKLINQFDPATVFNNKQIVHLGAYSATTVSWKIKTPALPAWCPMQVIIDCFNTLIEPNELDNQAIRPFTNGNYTLPGRIVITAHPNPPVLNSYANLSLCGNAWYEGTAVQLLDSSCAGATVTYTVVETGQSGSTYSNSLGNYCFSIYVPYPAGIYHVNVHITDYTLDGDTSDLFEVVVPPPVICPDLITSIHLGPSTVTPGSCHWNNCINILQGQALAGTITVTNAGNGASAATVLNIVSPQGVPNPAGPVNVPALNPGASFVTNIPAMVFNNLGGTFVSATADANNNVNECNEWNNTDNVCIMVHPASPDIVASGYNTSPSYECQYNSIPLNLDNTGGVATGAFTCSVQILLGGAVQATLFAAVNNLPALSCTTVYFNWPSLPNGHTIGNYTFAFASDIFNQVAESNEANNNANGTVTLLPCKPDLAVYGCTYLKVDPVNPQNPGLIDISATVANNGLDASGAFDVLFDIAGNHVNSHQPSLAPGQSREITIPQIPTPALGPNTLIVTADPMNLIDESNELNNEAISNCLGWDFYLSDLCGSGAFWHAVQIKNQPVILNVGVNNSGIYKASNLEISFEVKGPGLPVGWNPLPPNAFTYCGSTVCHCPFAVQLPNTFAFPEEGVYQVRMTADPHNDYIECDETNNVLIVSVTVADKPDYRVLSQYIAPSKLNPEPNEYINIDITYENNGRSSTDSITLYTQVDNNHLETDRVPGLMQGTFTTIHLHNIWNSNLRGIHVIRTFIDYDNEVVETNELDNEATRAIIVGKAPNLIFLTHLVSDTVPANGDQITISGIVKNIGYDNCTATLNIYYLDDQNNEVLIGQQPISLDTAETMPFSVPWTVVDTKTTIIGRISNASPMEYDVTDNEFTQNIGGAIELSFTRASASCHGTADGQAKVIIIGGQEPYSVIWSNGQTADSIIAAAGNYSVTVTDVDGLTATDDVTITQPMGMVVGVNISSPSSTICEGETAAFIAHALNGGNDPVYDWYINDVLQAEHGPMLLYSGPSANVYCVLTSNANCANGAQATSNTLSLTVNPLPAPPTANSPQTLYSPATIADIVVSGSNIQWYSTSTGGSPLLSSVQLMDGRTYFASQTVYGCESPRLGVEVIIPKCSPPHLFSQSTDAQTQCLGGAFNIISVASTGTHLVYQWYENTVASTSGGTAVGANSFSYTPSAAAIGTNYYYCVISGDCGTPVTSLISGAFTVNPLPAPPTADSPQTLYSPATIADIVVSGSNVQWYSASTGGNPLLSTFQLMDGRTYYASQTVNGCESPRLAVEVIIPKCTPPHLLSQSTAAQTQCTDGAFNTISVTATGTSLVYQWYENSVANTTGGTAVGADTNFYTPSVAIEGTHYYYCVISGECGTPVTSLISGAFVVNPASVGGSISGTSSIVFGSSTGTLTLSGYAGNILGWEKKLNSGSWVSIANTNATYNEIPTSTGNWYYRVKVKRGSCAVAYSNAFLVSVTKMLNIKVFLEGLYAGGGIMNQANGNSGHQFAVGIADTIKVELHNASAPYATAYSFGNLNLLTDGTIAIDAVSGSISGSYYIVVKHRNSIETWSNSAVNFIGAGPFSYDFTVDIATAYGNNLKPMGSIFAIFAGDANQDGIVDASDMAAIDNASTAIQTGYYPEDINGEGLVDASDMAIIDNNSTAVVHVHKPY